MNSFNDNYILNDNKNLDQYDQNATTSKIMPSWSYPVSLVYQNEIPIGLVHKWT